jgi:hypothetical protein
VLIQKKEKSQKSAIFEAISPSSVVAISNWLITEEAQLETDNTHA